jgi:hypothetical protein
MSSLGAYVSARGIKDGLLRGKRLWTVLGIVVWVFRLIARMASRKPVIVAREVLQPGQSITITSVEQTESK